MEQEQLQISTTGGEVISQWDRFLTRIKGLRPYSQGQYLLKPLDYNQTLIDSSNRKNIIQRLFAPKYQSGSRYFLLYVPQLSPEHRQKKLPLIILLHGTGSTMLTTELIFMKGNQTPWMDLADKEKFVLLIPQSRGLIYRGIKHIVWQPGSQDILYLREVVFETLKLKNRLDFPAIDQDNINIIGKSNGGLFVSELFLAYTSKQNICDVNKLGFRINLFCNYMGGLEIQNDREVFDFDEQSKQVSILIMTCQGEDNYVPCLRAFHFFDTMGCNVKLLKVAHNRHEFVPESVPIIYSQIRKAYEQHKERLYKEKL